MSTPIEIALSADAVPSEQFRDVMSAFATPVAVVTALDDDGLPRGLTCSSLCSVSLEPPTLLVCVNQRNGSLAAIKSSGGFVVNLLSAGRDDVARVFASPSPEKFRDVAWQPTSGSGLPWLSADTIAYLECRLETHILAATHAILVGTVVGTWTSDSEDGPMVCWRRSLGRWSSVPPQQVTPVVGSG